MAAAPTDRFQDPTPFVTGLERRRREVVAPFLLRLTLVLHRIVPWPVDWLLLRTGWRRPPA